MSKPVAYRFCSPATEEWLLGLEPPVGSGWEIGPLYAHPLQRKPLTDEEIERIATTVRVDPIHAKKSTWHIRLIRAVEKAYGIGGEG